MGIDMRYHLHLLKYFILISGLFVWFVSMVEAKGTLTFSLSSTGVNLWSYHFSRWGKVTILTCIFLLLNYYYYYYWYCKSNYYNKVPVTYVNTSWSILTKSAPLQYTLTINQLETAEERIVTTRKQCNGKTLLLKKYH